MVSEGKLRCVVRDVVVMSRPALFRVKARFRDEGGEGRNKALHLLPALKEAGVLFAQLFNDGIGVDGHGVGHIFCAVSVVAFSRSRL